MTVGQLLEIIGKFPDAEVRIAVVTSTVDGPEYNAGEASTIAIAPNTDGPFSVEIQAHN